MNTKKFWSLVGMTCMGLVIIMCMCLSLVVVSNPNNFTPTPITYVQSTSTETLEVINTTEATYTATPTITSTISIPIIQVTLPNHPNGTSGKCRDDSYTKSDNRQGACSHHGGILEWWGK